MQLRFFTWLFVCALIATVSSRAQTATAPIVGGAELIIVAKATPGVTMTVKGVTTPIKKDDTVPQQAKVNTGNGASVVLAFSNGATLRLESNSELEIEEYLQDPFTAVVKVAELKAEPSRSRTRLALNRGELVGDVKPLDHNGGSTFRVQTPVGAAGIRGTIFRIVFRPDGTGQAFFTLSTAAGLVNFEQAGSSGGGTTPSPGATPTPGPNVTGTGSATGVGVPQGQEIAITVNVTQNTTGQLVATVVPPVTNTTNITSANLQTATNAAKDIAVAVEKAIFVPAPAGGGTGGTTSGSTSGSTTVTGPNFTAQVKTEPPPPATDQRIIPTNPGSP